MPQKTVRVSKSVAFLSVTAFAAAVCSLCFCYKDVFSLLQGGTFHTVLKAIIKAELLVVPVFVAVLIFLIKKGTKRDCLILCVPILWGMFFLFRFSSGLLVRSYVLIFLQSCVCIAYFLVCAQFLVFLQNKVCRLGRIETFFALFWFALATVLSLVATLQTRSVDLCISAVTFGAIPCLILVRRLFSAKDSVAEPQLDYKSEKRKYINYYTVLLFLGCIFFTLYYFNREATDLEGIDAYCAMLLSQGKMIYRDFYFYVPPLYILRQYLVWFLFNGAILPIRILGIAERALLICLVFRLLCRWFKPGHAFVASTFAFLLYNSNLFNSYGDYTQVCQLLLIIAAYFAALFAEQVREKNEKKAFLWLFAASLIATQSLMCKQSIGLIALLFLFIILVLYCLAAGEGKRTVRWLACVLLGFSVSLLPYLLWLGMNGALSDFIDQVFLASLNSKGLAVSGTASESSTFVRIFHRVVNRDSIVLWGSSLLAVFFHLLQRKTAKACAVWRTLRIIFILLTVLKVVERLHRVRFGASMLELAAAAVRGLSRPQLLLLALVIVFFAVCFALGRLIKCTRNNSYTVILSLAVFLSWFIATLYPLDELRVILASFSTGETWPVFYELAFHFCAIFFVSELAHLAVEKKSAIPLESWFFLAVAMANAVVSLMGGGTASFACNGALYTIPFAVCIWLSLFRTAPEPAAAFRFLRPVKSIAFIASCGLLLIGICSVSFLSMGQHINCVYSFYGWTAEPITDENAYSIELERYAGMRVSAKTKLTLEQVTKLVEENTESGDFVWTFPAAKIYNILTGRLEQPTFAPTYFFDTCPDEIAYSDLEILKSNPPDLIVWKEMGEDCWLFYEENYRNGAELGQREIQRWFESVRETEYILIGNVYNEYVYKRIDGTQPSYTYFSDGLYEESVNEAAQELPKSNTGNALYEWFSGEGLISVNRAMALLTVILCGMPALILLGRRQLWKVLCMVLSVAALTLEMSWVYYFIFAFVFVYALFFEEKSIYTWGELMILGLIVLFAMLQWGMFWPVLQTYVALLPALLYIVLTVDGAVLLCGRNREKIRS